MKKTAETELWPTNGTKCTFQRCRPIDCVDMARRSSATARGRQTTGRTDGKNKSSYTHGCRAVTWR